MMKRTVQAFQHCNVQIAIDLIVSPRVPGIGGVVVMPVHAWELEDEEAIAKCIAEIKEIMEARVWHGYARP